MPPWDPELDVDAPLARRLIAAQFSWLADAPVRYLATGWDNIVYAVGEELVFRFPQRAIALPGIRREIEVLPEIAARLPFAIPFPLHLGSPSAGYPWSFYGARRIHGQELARGTLREDGRQPLASQLGAALRALHNPVMRDVVDERLPHDPLSRADMAVRVPMTRERLAEAVAIGLLDAATARGVEPLLAAAESLAPPTDLALAHGDLHIRHVVVDAGGGLAGIIDWGDMCLADPAIDLAIPYAHLPRSARQAFFAAYGPIGRDAELRARVLAIMLSAALAVAARDRGEAWLERTAAEDLRRACGEATIVP